MSEISLSLVKADLRITDTSADTLLQVLLDAAEAEACRFLNRDYLPTLPLDYPEESSVEDIPSSGDPLAADIYAAIFLLVRAKYDAQTPDEIAMLRRAAEGLLQPYRTEIGI